MNRIIPILIFIVFIISSNCNSKNITSNNETPKKYFDAIIYADSNQISVISGDEILGQLDVEKGKYFHERIVFDNKTQLMSILQCTALEQYRWSYEAIVWDYKSGQKWNLLSGQSYDGEGYHGPYFYQFDPSLNDAIVQSYYWEGTGVEYYRNGKLEYIARLPEPIVLFLAKIGEQDVLLKAYPEYEVTTHYYIYSQGAKEFQSISFQEASKYSAQILDETNQNIDVNAKDLYKTFGSGEAVSWDKDGKYVVLRSFDSETRTFGLRLFDYEAKKELNFDELKNAKSVIWRTN